MSSTSTINNRWLIQECKDSLQRRQQFTCIYVFLILEQRRIIYYYCIFKLRLSSKSCFFAIPMMPE